MSFNALNFFFAQVHLAWLIVVPVLCIAAAGCGGWLVTRFVLNKKIGKAKNVAQSIVDEAKIEAKTLKKEAILEAKEEVLKLKRISTRNRRNAETRFRSRNSGLFRKRRRWIRKRTFFPKRTSIWSNKSKAFRIIRTNLTESSRSLKNPKKKWFRSLKKFPI